jgi:ABC-type transport system involved in cytochrome c biogenesis permease component
MQGTWALTLRSLRQDSRLLRFHLLRLAIALGVTLALYAVYKSIHYSEAPGRDLLEALGWGNFWAVTIAGVLLFAPTITEEKEDQTLGLLRMTGIGPSSLLLGKALPKLVQLLLVLIVQLPLVWLTITLGGVDWPLMFNVYLVVFSQLVGVVALSLLASVMMRTSGGAVVLASGMVAFWEVGVLFLWVSSGIRTGGPNFITLASLSPAVQMDTLQLRSGATASGAFWTVGVSLVLAGAASLLSVWSFNYWNQHESTQTELEWLHEKWQRAWDWLTHFRRSRQSVVTTPASPDQPASPALPLSAAVPQPVDGPPSGRRRRSIRSWNNAVAWKDYFLLGGGKTGIRVRCTVAGLGMIGIVILASDLAYAVLIGTAVSVMNSRWFPQAMEAIIVCAFYAFVFDLLYLTVNLFASELRRQTWESLKLLPLPLGTICRRKILGAACHLIPWVVAFLCGLAMVTTTEDLRDLWRDVTDDPLATLGIVLQVVTQFMTALLVLTWFSLRFNPWIAILLTGALYWAIAIGWVITALMTFGFMSSPGPYYLQVLFHVGWIGGITLLGGGTLWSIRSTLRGEAASV